MVWYIVIVSDIVLNLSLNVEWVEKLFRGKETLLSSELLYKIENQAKNDKLKEVIIALSLNPQGEHTDMYLREKISPLEKKYGFKIVSLGRGLSTGIELEYSDGETIKNALKNRS